MAENPVSTADSPVVGALELGGSHVSGALVDTRTLTIVEGTRRRRELDPVPSAEGVLSVLAALASDLPRGITQWALAVPGPFDYELGIAMFAGVGKFEALHGLDLRAALAATLPALPERIRFTNDADAFLLGACAAGSVRGHTHCAALTLGTGVGSAFAIHDRTVPAEAGVLPGGRAHLLRCNGLPLEDVVSTRAIVAAYRAHTGRVLPGVKAVADLARHGDRAAYRALDDALTALCTTMRPYLDRFGATALVIGGSLVHAWDVVRPSLERGLAEAGPGPGPFLIPESDTEGRSLVGAVKAVVTTSTTAWQGGRP
jgi:glucokinase